MQKVFAGSVAVLATEVHAQQDINQLMKSMNLKENAKQMFGGMKVDMSKLQAGLNSGELLKQLGVETEGEGAINLQEMNGAAHDLANTFGLGNYLDSVENSVKDKWTHMDGSVMQDGQKIWQHMQDKASNQGLGAAFKDGMNEAMAYSQSNPQLRETLAPLKDGMAHLKKDGMRGLVADAAHNPMIENALESNGFHVNDLLTKLGAGDKSGKAGLEKLMDHHREQIESEFDANNSHFSYFFAFVIFVVCCAIAVALWEIYELRRNKKKPAATEMCENMV